MGKKNSNNSPHTNVKLAKTMAQRMRVYRARKQQQKNQTFIKQRLMPSTSQPRNPSFNIARKPKTVAERMRAYRACKRQQNAHKIPKIGMDERRRLYRAKLRLQRLSQASEQSSNLQPGQDQSAVRENNNIFGELPSQNVRRHASNQFYDTFIESPGKIVIMPKNSRQEKYFIKNEYGNLCTLWLSSKPKVSIKREVVTSNETPDNRNLLQPAVNHDIPIVTSTFDPRRRIKVEPTSDDEEIANANNVNAIIAAIQGTSAIHTASSVVNPPVNADEECSAYGKFIEQKLKNFSQRTRDAVQHAFGNIIYEASQGIYEHN